MRYRIESDYRLASDLLPVEAFDRFYESLDEAIAIAIEGVDDPEEQEVRVVCVDTAGVVWRSTEAEFG